jgi:hypothetical protein
MRLRSLMAVCALLITIGFSVIADEANQFKTKLTGFKETPSVLSGGSGTFTSTLDATGTSLSYTLTYSGLSSTAGASHIHFAQPGVPGGIVAFLCGGGGKPACPAGDGTVTGTISAADVLGLPSQGVTAGSFSDFLSVLRSGDAYVNVHTTVHPAGEIRGQIRAAEDNDETHD